MTPVATLKRNALNAPIVLNILSLSYDGNFEEFLTETGHNIFELDIQKAKEEYKHSSKVGLFKYIRDNDKLHLLPPLYVSVDLILCNGEAQIQNGKQISFVLHAPLIYVDHIGNIPNLAKQVASLCVSAVDKNSDCFVPYYQTDWINLFNKARNIPYKI